MGARPFSDAINFLEIFESSGWLLSNASEAVKKLILRTKSKTRPFVINDLQKRNLAIFNFFTASQ
jgi:hypothetical protein